MKLLFAEVWPYLVCGAIFVAGYLIGCGVGYIEGLRGRKP